MPAASSLELGSLSLENFDKLTANNLALGFRIAHASKVPEKLASGVHPNHFGMQFSDKHLHHHVALVQAKQTMIDKHASELVANGAVNQRCRDR